MRISLPFPRARGQTDARRPVQPDQRWLALPVVLALIAAGTLAWLPGRLAPATTSTTTTVTQGALTVAVTGSGAVAAARTVDLAFRPPAPSRR